MSASIGIRDFAKTFSQLSRRVLSNVQTATYIEAKLLTDEIIARSPLDEGTFRKGWKLSGASKSGGKISAYRIYNETPYGHWLEEGGEVKGAPWYFPNANNKGPVSNSGKLKIMNGRVWAGCRSPAGFVVQGRVGGAIDLVLYYNPKRQMSVARAIAESIMAAI